MSKEEAVEIATREASLTPCGRPGCVVVRFVQRGIPVRGYWLVGLRTSLDADDPGSRTENLLVDARTGEVSKP